LIQAAPWLRELIPLGEADVTTRMMDPSAIETYTSSQNPLDDFAGVMLPKRAGRILITGRTTRRVSTPLAAEYIVGLGRVTVMAADLDGPEFATWPERLPLILRLTGTVLTSEDETPTATNRATAFDDLAGQMRASLDQFPLKRKLGFSIVALILMALIAAIGPLDYLLVNRVFGRPLLGWLTFPLVAVGLSAVLIYQSRPLIAEKSPPDSGQPTADDLIRCNRVEIIDIDAVENVGRGFMWGSVYSHPATQLDVMVGAGGPIESISARVESVLTAPYGYPGRAFGGVQIVGEDARFRECRVSIEGDRQRQANLSRLSLAPRSSKSIATRFSFSSRLPDDLVMARREGSEVLDGALTNPFPFDLLDGMLVYRNLVYLLPTRFPVGARIDSIDQLRQKNFRWQLTRRTALEQSKTEREQWVPTQFDQPRRVADMLMFHRAVGGSRYTGLRDDPMSFLDLSDLLTESRCMLVGRLPRSALELSFVPHGDQPERARMQPPGQTLTLLRLLIPVEVKKR
jgi:hypothetical protein